MSNLIPGNQKHLSQEDRVYIEEALNEGNTFKNIAKFLCKDPTTISKEVRLHRLNDVQPKRIFNNPNNFCTKRFHCKKMNVCDKIIICDVKCSSCPRCNQVCKSFTKEQCTRLDKAPYVCNGCDKPKHRCSVPHKYFYNSRYAQRKYEELRKTSREGINLTKKQALQMDAIISPLIAQGQSPYVIATNHPELGASVKTIYNYIDQGILLTRNVDLKRKAKFKPRKHTKKGIKNREAFIGRTYKDFKALNPKYFIEMDTVLSAKGSNKCILTFYIPETELFIARLLNRCTEGAVKAVIDQMESALGIIQFLTVFEVCLSDRGTQYTSELYRKAIKKYGILQSMNSAGGRCHDNARCESMWARLKEELLYNRHNTIKLRVERVKTLIWRYFISYWNNRRICSTNGGLPPMIKRQQYYNSLQDVA